MKKYLLKMKKETTIYIDRDTYLRALGLHTLGRQYYDDATRMEKSIHKLLGISENYSHLSDSMISGDPTFDEALKRERFVVRDVRKTKKKK